jgi:predicted nuclease with TOPRIM domain
MEKMYNEQYESQNKVISELRQEVLKLTKEKFESDERIVLLEGENSSLRTRVDGLEKELMSYKSLKP